MKRWFEKAWDEIGFVMDNICRFVTYLLLFVGLVWFVWISFTEPLSKATSPFEYLTIACVLKLFFWND
jgi:hypothetical protein